MTSEPTVAVVNPYKESIRLRGKPLTIDALRIDGPTYLIRGKLLRTAELRYPWQFDVADPEQVIHVLKKSKVRVDLFKFWQRIPDAVPRFPYYHEWHNPAAIPVTTHEAWFTKQLDKKARNKVRKSEKQGVQLRQEALSDELIRKIMGIYNDSPVRRGKPFWHYGKDFDTVKKELLDDPTECTYVTAYVGEELIGFVKLLFYDRYARTTLILDKQSRRDIGCMNSMVSKVVEICAERGIPYFVYSYWRRGNHGQFQRSNGFEKHAVPEYFVPLTLMGRIALALRLHRGILGWVPEQLMVRLLDLRARWYARKYGTKAFRVEGN